MATSEGPGLHRVPLTHRRLLALDPASSGALRAVAALTAAAGLLRLAQLVALGHLVDDLVGRAGGDARRMGHPGELPADLRSGLLLIAAPVVLGVLLGALARARAASATAAATQRLAERVLTGAAQHPVVADDRVAALLTGGLDRLDVVLAEQWSALVRVCVVPAGAAALLFCLDWRSAVAGVVLVPLVPLLGAVVGVATAARVKRSWQQVSSLGSLFLDSVAGLVALKLAGATDARGVVIERASEAHRRLSLGVLRTAFLSSTATGLVSGLGVGLVAVVCGTRVVDGSLDLRTALVVVLLTPELYRAVVDLGGRFHLDARSRAVLDDLESVLDARPAAPADARARAARTALWDVSATHAGRSAPAVDAVTATFARGRVTAVVGPSGAGKSTLLRVLAGTMGVAAGRVEVSGATGYLPQHPRFPTARTVGEAVRAGRDDVGDEQLRDALHRACAASLLEADGEGLGRRLAGAGEALSAGERQRLGLARAYCGARRAGDVLVLDEPTAHLDPVTERVVLQRLVEHTRRWGLTVVMAAHRPAALGVADTVVSLPGLPTAPAGSWYPAAAASAVPGASRPAVLPPAHALPPVAPAAAVRRSGAVAVLGVLVGASSSLCGVALTAVAAALLVRASAHPPLLALSLGVVAVRFLALARPLLRYAERLLVHDAAFRDLTALRVRTWEQLVPRVPGLGVPARGDLLTRTARDVDDRVEGAVRGMFAAAVLVLGQVLVLAVLAVALPRLALVVLAVVVAAGAAAVLADVALGAAALRAVQRCRGQRDAAVVDVMAALDDVVGTAGTTGPIALTGPATRRAAVAQARLTAIETLTDTAVTALAGLLPVATAAVLALRAPGAVPAVLAAALVLGMVPLGEEVGALPAAVRALRLRHEASRRITAVTTAIASSTDPATEEGPAAPTPAPDTAATGLDSGVVPGLHLDRVGAAWDPGARTALVDLALDLAPGSRVAVTGASGSGKSTLAAVTLHLLDPTTGAVRLDGSDYRVLSGTAVRRRVGAVGVADHIFADTVRANVTLGRPGAATQEVLDVLDRVELMPWLASLPAGLDTVLGSGGSSVSGGEALRLCTARTLLLQPDVIVLDEPVEGLDAPTARAVLHDLAEHGQGESWLLLTHRAEGLELVDDVRAIQDGRLHRIAPPTRPPEPDGTSAPVTHQDVTPR